MLEPWLPASVSYLLLRQENGHLFNLSMPGLQYDLPEVSKMASLVPLIPSQTPAVPHLRDSGHSCLAFETIATLLQLPFIHMPHHIRSQYPPRTRHCARHFMHPGLSVSLCRGLMLLVPEDSWARAAVTCGSLLLWRLNESPSKQPTDIYIPVHNSSKITLRK